VGADGLPGGVRGGGYLLVVRLDDEQDELVARQPRGEDDRVRHGGQAPADLREQVVASLVTEGVVEGLTSSRSSRTTPTGRPWCSAARSRVRNARRLGRPVVSSCRAWWRYRVSAWCWRHSSPPAHAKRARTPPRQ
jgi:hypothetical protein